MSEVNYLEVDAKNPIGSVIWLHGLGADGGDFFPIVEQLSLPKWLKLRFIFPHAPIRQVSINGNMPMRAWFDINSLDIDDQQDIEGISESIEFINNLIEMEHLKGIAYDRILLAGFSQGGVIAIHAAMKFQYRLAGLLGLSTYLPLSSLIRNELKKTDVSTNKSMSVMICHGLLDTVLPISYGKEACAIIESSGYRVVWNSYSMEHSVCIEEINDIRKWLLEIYKS